MGTIRRSAIFALALLLPAATALAAEVGEVLFPQDPFFMETEDELAYVPQEPLEVRSDYLGGYAYDDFLNRGVPVQSEEQHTVGGFVSDTVDFVTIVPRKVLSIPGQVLDILPLPSFLSFSNEDDAPKDAIGSEGAKEEQTPPSAIAKLIHRSEAAEASLLDTEKRDSLVHSRTVGDYAPPEEKGGWLKRGGPVRRMMILFQDFGSGKEEAKE